MSESITPTVSEPDAFRQHPAPKRWIAFIVKCAISGTILLLIARNIDLSNVWNSIKGIPVAYAIVALLALVAQTVLMTARWRLIARFFGVDIPFIPALRVLYIGLLANQGFPSFIAGDAIRAYWMRKRGGSLGNALRIVIIDRVTALVVLVLLLVPSIGYLLPNVTSPTVVTGLWIILLSGLFGILLFFLLDHLPRRLRDIGPVAAIVATSAQARRLARNARESAVVSMQALVGHLLTAIYLYVMVRGIRIDLSFLQCLALMPPIVLISMLPFSIAGWGIREGTMITAMAIFGIAPELAFSVSVLYGIFGLLHGMIGFPAMFLSDRRPAGPSGESGDGPV